MKGDKKSTKSMMKRLFPSPPADEMEAAGERVLRRLHTEMPQEIAAFNAREAKPEPTEGIAPAVRRRAESLQPVDQLVLGAVWLLRGEGHAGHILRKVEEWTSKEPGLNAVYISLDRLEAQGLVSVRTAPLDNFERHLYTITKMGMDVLAVVSPAQHAIEKLGDFA